MLNDEELEKLSVGELQDLAVTNPPNLNQIVKHLNRKAINRPIELAPPSEYEAAYRSIGPGSWFYDFMSQKPWHKYLRKNKINKNE